MARGDREAARQLVPRGARLLLIDGDLVNAVNAIAGKITYKPMQDDPEFMKEYLGAVFIPIPIRNAEGR